ncbi:class I SAM-dependent methyltransferase [Aggregatilinea lenta]|uniref:class I SAM-dependent methyltransferase n=1 Tax=Aggregatilinea lenta TaxID=913108 RepID=UPI0013C2EE0E|nr:class I SAM-dependent methyltransferase [Aggregatilinea lenta]
MTTNDTTLFYNAVADDYHLQYRDWDAELEREGLNLRRYFRAHEVKSVLDASCGPGTQSIALARLGYQVTAADPSAGLLERARQNAEHFGVLDRITFVQSDFQGLLDAVEGPFDAVLTKGNALPHLLHDEQIEEALLVLHDLLRPGGLLLIGMRDFEPLLEDRPRFWPGRVHDEPEEQIITFDLWDWDDGPPVTVTVNNFVVRGSGQAYQVSKHPVVFRALTAEEVEVVILEVGFKEFSATPDRWELLISAVKPEE